jgi:hypothetical protein
MTVVDFKPRWKAPVHVANVDEPTVSGMATALNSAHAFPRAQECGELAESIAEEAGDCAATRAYDRVCQANDRWSECIPGDDRDGASITELERAYDAFYQTRASSLEGLRLQFESLVAVTDIEGDETPHPRVLTLLESLRVGFEWLERENRRDLG